MAISDYIREKPVIRSQRLRLRTMCAEDVPALREWMADPAIYTYWGKRPGRTDKQPELLFKAPERQTKSLHLGMEELETGMVIGELWVYLIEKDRMAAVAIRIAPSRQGRGYGREALTAITRFVFEHTQLRRLWAQVDARNLPSQRLFEACGYTREGLIRQGRMVNTWCDYYIYGILDSDVALKE